MNVVDPSFNLELLRDTQLLIPWKASWFENVPEDYYYPFEENNTEAATSGG